MHRQPQGRAINERTFRASGIDYLELYVGNAKHATHFYRTAFGFRPVAYAGPETGVRDRVSFLVEQGAIRLLLTSPMDADGPITEHFNLHGDGVKDIALTVDDAAAAFAQTVAKGARPIMEPTAIENGDGRVLKATIATFGDTVHSFIQRDGYRGAFLPHFIAIENPPKAVPVGLDHVDHLAVGVERGEADRWASFYRNILDLQVSQEEDISSDYSGMSTRVLRNEADNIVLVIVESLPGKRQSPIDEYLMYYGTAGVHHIAVRTEDIVGCVGSLRANGVEFARTPDSYYESLSDRVGAIAESVADLRHQNILVDRDAWGYLMQIFVKPMQTRPTFFFEVIQRAEARGFGSGNIKALFEAIEREQVMRGNA